MELALGLLAGDETARRLGGRQQSGLVGREVASGEGRAQLLLLLLPVVLVVGGHEELRVERGEQEVGGRHRGRRRLLLLVLVGQLLLQVAGRRLGAACTGCRRDQGAQVA